MKTSLEVIADLGHSQSQFHFPQLMLFFDTGVLMRR